MAIVIANQQSHSQPAVTLSPVFSSDCLKSGTLIGSYLSLVAQVQNEDPTHEKLQLFNKLWTMSFAPDSILIFSTGRSPALFCELWVRLIAHDYLVSLLSCDMYSALT